MRARRLPLFAALVVAGMVPALAPAALASAASGWRIQSSPTPTGRGGILTGVSCPSSTDCLAVGLSSDASFNARRLVQRWNGAAWAIETTPAPTGTTAWGGVSCAPKTSTCTVVGGDETGALVDRWDGHQWTTQAVPKVRDSNLAAVDCLSPTSCVAVGTGSTDSFSLIMRWDGKHWTTQHAPSSSLADDSLNGVSCVSATFCTAVGNNNDGEASDTPLIEHWDGTKWSFQHQPNMSRWADLNSIKCLSTTNCWAAGLSYAIQGSEMQTKFRGLLEHWDGHAWSVVTAPAPAGAESGFFGITCVQTTCLAVGSSDNSGSFGRAQKPFVDRWNGHAWTMDAAAVPGSGRGELYGAACVTPTTCVAVGDVPALSEAQYRTLIERRG